ncbi:MAG: DUF2993 domain-containing protein [Cyanobacteria bacterium J06638_28]
MSDASNMGEQAISKLAEMGLKTQLDECDNLTVKVQVSPETLAEGEIESVTIDGQGLAMQGDELRTAKLHVETGAIAITPWKAAFGNIELKQTVEAQADITLTEQDINQALNSEYLLSKFEVLQVHIDGQTFQIVPLRIEFRLPGEGRAAIQANVETLGESRQYTVAFTAIPVASSDGHRIVLKEIAYENNVDTLDEVTTALIESTAELLDMRNFELEGMNLRIRELTILTGRLEIKADASVEEFPGG